jgi:hypothetical protein
MRPVEILLTDDLALKARFAIDSILADDNYVMTDEEEADFKRLAVFLGQVATNPAQFKPQGKNALRVRSIVRSMRGAAQPQSRKNKRKIRQHNRQGYAKWRRRERKRLVEEFNRARELYEQDAREAAEYWAEVEERVAKQTQYDVVTLDGQTVLAGIPAEFIRLTESGEPAFPQLIVVGGE